MKGFSSAINVVVIIMLALIVLVVIITVFNQGVERGEASLTDQEKWQRACAALMMRGCSTDAACSVDDPITIGGSTFVELCASIAGSSNCETCAQMCCQGGAT